MFIDAWYRKLWETKLAPAQRTAFFSCLFTGLLVHLYAFTNLLPNSDGLSRMYDLQQMTISGRWFLHYASALNGFTQMPMAIGLLSLVLLALAAALTVDLLGLKSQTLAGLAGAVMAAFPCLGYTFLYLFTASAYCLAILLAVLSVWLARHCRIGWCLGVCALALSMGIYQVYACLAIGLSLLTVFRETLEPSADFSETLRLGLRLMAFLAAGAALYYAVLLVFLRVKNLELLSYLGMDAANAGYPFAQLPRLILSAYKQTIAFFFLPGSANGFTTLWMAALDLGFLAVSGWLLLVRLKQLDWQPWRVLGAFAMAGLLPLGVNFGQLLSPYSVPTPLMKYAFVLIYLTVLLLLSLSDGQPALRLAGPVGTTLTALLLLFCLNTNNLLYTASAQAHRATESFLTRLMTQVECCSGYERGMEIAVIGAPDEELLRNQLPAYRQVEHYSVPLDSVLPLNKHIYYYLQNWLNVPISEPEETTLLQLAASPEFQAMPLYPAQGSVQVLNGRAVVKLQETYTPKSDYEIAYENRR